MRGEGFLFGLLLLWSAGTQGALAQTPELEPQDTVSKETDIELPSMDFLEFLGEWETEENGWVDPVELDEWIPPEEPQEEEKNDDS